MRLRPTALLLVIAALAAVAVVPAGASAATSTTAKKRPVITRVTPMRVRVGALLTIRGRNFSSRRTRNTVVFRAANGRTAFSKPRRASRRRLVVRVPLATARILNGTPSRFRLRVLSNRRFSRFTTRRLSPVLVPTNFRGIDGLGGAAASCPEGDFDGDLLVSTLETSVGLDPCLDDTDGDGASDGWEYYSAKDLTIKAVPYPGQRPFPNALDPSDRNVDYDGDGLLLIEEYRAWRVTGSSYVSAKAGGGDLESPLGYSDGTQYSRASEVPAVPAWRSASLGLGNPTQPFPATFDMRTDGSYTDDERDADRDGLSNFLESARGPSNNEWWKGYWAEFEPAVESFKEKSYCGYRPGYYPDRPFANLDLADGDVDGDTLLDGEDDQDSDDVDNITELYEALMVDLDGDGNTFCGWSSFPTVGGAPINAFNACAPDPTSRTCSRYVSF